MGKQAKKQKFYFIFEIEAEDPEEIQQLQNEIKENTGMETKCVLSEKEFRVLTENDIIKVSSPVQG